jgi:phosphoribosylaminoimidazole-succinocarboxamide synthase
MKVIYEGKTKRIVSAGERMVLQFKDDITGDADGNVDSGGDFVVGRMEGKGAASAKVAAFIFKLLSEAGIETHFRKLRSSIEIEVLRAERIPLEVIYRAKAYGSFLTRYRARVEKLSPLDLIEFNLKDDALRDPLITPQAITKLGIASASELQQIEVIVRKVASVVVKVLVAHKLDLIDMKLEFGRVDGKLLVVDELSGDTMRVHDSTQKNLVNQVELAGKLGLI